MSGRGNACIGTCSYKQGGALSGRPKPTRVGKSSLRFPFCCLQARGGSSFAKPQGQLSLPRSPPNTQEPVLMGGSVKCCPAPLTAGHFEYKKQSQLPSNTTVGTKSTFKGTLIVNGEGEVKKGRGGIFNNTQRI